jgi:hypothetical protein
MTTLATGKDTTVLFVGNTGPAQVIGPMRAATARADQAATAGTNITSYPPIFASTGMPTYMKWGLGIGGTAVVLGAGAALSDGDGGNVPLTVQESPPASSSTIPPIAATFDVTFTFSKDINPISISNNFNELSGFWTLSVLSQSPRVVIIRATLISTPSDLIVELVNIQGTDGSALQPPTQFTYTIG